jgi:diguanylate cyclase (GGDEF)-like protein
MDLDVKTMFVVTIAVAAVLGFLLFYAWFQERRVSSLAWWGGAHFVACSAVWLISQRGELSDFWCIEIANALLLVAAGMTWMGARLFDGNKVSFVGIFGGATVWLLATYGTNFTAMPHAAAHFSSMIVAAYSFGAAIEIWRGRHEGLASRLPLVVMLSMHGALYLLRVPLSFVMPVGKGDALLSSAWFGVIALESLLYMIATAFIFLAMAKERLELEHKVAATTDPLTGIANRRAFLESATRSLKQRTRTPQPVSALLFDLDRFKSINDQFGHAIGDRVLRAFTDIAVTELRSTDLLGRLGGEEFGALLFGAEASSAAATAERIRAAFEENYAREGVGAKNVSVSVGVASVPADEAVEVETLMSKADEALYVAKARGRNRVEVADGYRTRCTGLSGRDMHDKPLQVREGPAVVLGAIASPSVVPNTRPSAELSDVSPALHRRAELVRFR